MDNIMVPVWNTGGGVWYLIHIVAYCHVQYSETYNNQLRDAMENMINIVSIRSYG
jgi:hypothetical protein